MEELDVPEIRAAAMALYIEPQTAAVVATMPEAIDC